ncbi:uncharacterized protein LOC132273580 isoform X2 [Cornus florida]|uniref:uncharacterized protein LOC132273580 isoform X2 n=1 Tax=Cornus florida TaxID=4283 RepID=UPI0028A1C586|nr:uncharacterized protein LOC132273580 isoform X2 [Cornus florida]
MCSVSSAAARLLIQSRTLATSRSLSLVSPLCWSSRYSSKLGFFSFQLRKSVSARKLVVRAARTESKGASLGFRPPQFQLPEPLTGKMWKLEDFESYPALLVMFICNHCPFVKHLKKDIVKLSNFYMKKGLAVVAISSNSVATHPQDGPQLMAEEAKQFNYPFPYLYDESQDVARDFGAVCTPEFFLFKKDGRRPFELVYHGQFDDSRPSNNVPVTGRDLSLAIDRVLSAQPASSVQKPSSSHFSICQKCWMQHKVASRNKAVICDAVPFSIPPVFMYGKMMKLLLCKVLLCPITFTYAMYYCSNCETGNKCICMV